MSRELVQSEEGRRFSRFAEIQKRNSEKTGMLKITNNENKYTKTSRKLAKTIYHSLVRRSRSLIPSSSSFLSVLN